MSLEDHLAGASFVVFVLAATFYSGWRLERHLSPQPGAVGRLLALAVWCTVVLFAAAVVPGLVGILNRWTIAVTAVMVAFGCHITLRGSGVEVTRERWCMRTTSSDRVAVAVAAVCAGAVLTYAIAATLALGRSPAANVDAVGFHLPLIGQWLQDGSVFGMHQFLPGIPTGQYPQTGDVLLLHAIAPWSNDAFVRLANLPFLAVASLAAYATGREIGASAAMAVVGVATFLSVPAVHEPVLDMVMTDAPLLAMFGAGMYFLVRHSRAGSSSDLGLATLALGLAFGTKWYGVSNVIALLVAWTAIGMVATRDPLMVFRHLALIASGVVALGGIWLLRNWIETGNPVSPVEVSVLGVSLFGAPRIPFVEDGFSSLLSYAGQPGVWSEFILPAFNETLALPALALVAAAVVATPLGARRLNRSGGAGVVALGGIVVMLLLCVYVVTPASAFGPEGRPVLVGANTRYVAPALLVATPVAAWLLSQGSGFRAIGLAIAPVAVYHGLAQGYDSGADGAISFAWVIAALALALFAVVTRWLARTTLPSLATRAAGLLFVPTLVVAGYVWQQRFNEQRYRQSESAFTYVLEHGKDGTRVALTGVADLDGVYPVWPFFGDRLENSVTVMGTRDRGVLFQHVAKDEFVAELSSLDPDFLAVGLGIEPDAKVPAVDWARTAGYEVVAGSDRVALFAKIGS